MASTSQILFGLEGAAQHNGKTGSVEGYDDTKERHVVKLKGEDTRLSLKHKNLTQPLTVDLLPELAVKGVILGFDVEKQGYVVKVAGEERVLTSDQVKLPDKTRVVMYFLGNLDRNSSNPVVWILILSDALSPLCSRLIVLFANQFSEFRPDLSRGQRPQRQDR